MIYSNDIPIREINTDDFENIMTVETEVFGYDKEAILMAELLADRTTEFMLRHVFARVFFHSL